MKWLMSVAFCILSAGALATAADAPKASQESRPPWCKAGYICITREEIADDAAYHIELREQVQQYRQRAQRFGLTVGVGFGVGGVISSEYDVSWTPVGGAFVVWGLRF